MKEGGGGGEERGGGGGKEGGGGRGGQCCEEEEGEGTMVWIFSRLDGTLPLKRHTLLPLHRAG